MSSAEPGTVDVLVLAARIQRSRRTQTADGLEPHFALTCLSRSLLSHGLAVLPGRAADPVVPNVGGAGRSGPARWGDLQQRTQYPGPTAMTQAGLRDAVSAGDAIPLDLQASSLADAQRLCDCTREVLAR